MGAVHSSPYAGSWYPGQPAELERLVEDLFARSRERTAPGVLREPVAFVVPHAGLVYSGAVAAAAYRSIAEAKPERILLLGFSHRGGPPAVAVPDVERIGTPLGEVAVDRAAAATLAACPGFQWVGEQRVCDHSVEIQLPLLVRATPGVPVVPLYVGALDPATREAAAQALARLAGPGTILVASSDLTHYGRSFSYEPFPPDSRVRERLRELDFGAIEAAGSLDPGLFLDYLARTGSTVCGYQPIALLLHTLTLLEGEELFQETLDYETSADITGDVRHSVSYGALGYFPARSFALGPADQALLLESAHATLRNLLETGRRTPVPPRTVTPALTRRSGAFVSLHEGTHLRGCVGHRAGAQPLAEAIPGLTLSAALDDPRFQPLHEAREPVEIEISVLTPMKLLAEESAFRLGEHGLYLTCGAHRALLLPQVAQDRAWTAEEFLGALARKAGLPADGWSRPGARLYAFRAQVFSVAPPGACEKPF